MYKLLFLMVFLIPSLSNAKYELEFYNDSETVTRGDDAILYLIAENNSTAQSIENSTITTYFTMHNGQKLQVTNSAHSIIESSGTNTGKFTITLNQTQSATLKYGKNINFYSEIVSSGGTKKTYSGLIDKVFKK